MTPTPTDTREKALDALNHLEMRLSGRAHDEYINCGDDLKAIRSALQGAETPQPTADNEPVACPAEYMGPYFVYDFMPQKIMFKSAMGDSQALDVLNVRGWGMLTGHGQYGKRMRPDVAALTQDTFGKWVAQTLNDALSPPQSYLPEVPEPKLEWPSDAPYTLICNGRYLGKIQRKGDGWWSTDLLKYDNQFINFHMTEIAARQSLERAARNWLMGASRTASPIQGEK